MPLATQEQLEQLEEWPNDILLEKLAFSSPTSATSTRARNILMSRGLSELGIDKGIQQKKKEYKRVRALIWFGYIRIVFWAILVIISYIKIDDSLWWLLGIIGFGIILLGDMLVTGFGAEYAIKGSGFEEKAKKNGLY
jgi:hypothetical protein